MPKSIHQSAFDFSFEEPATETIVPKEVETVEATSETVAAPAVVEKSKRGRKKKVVSLMPKTPGKRGRRSFKEMEAESDLVNIPEDEALFSKQYYSMSEVAEMFRANQSLIRMWANEFDKFLDPKKNKKGDRYFRPDDIKTLQLIHHLLRQRKYTMEGAKEYLKSQKKKGTDPFVMIESLQKLKAFLLELKASL